MGEYKTLEEFRKSSWRYKLLGEDHFNGRTLINRILSSFFFVSTVPILIVSAIISFCPAHWFSLDNWSIALPTNCSITPMNALRAMTITIVSLSLIVEWCLYHPELYNILPFPAGDPRNTPFLPKIVFFARFMMILGLFLPTCFILLGRDPVLNIEQYTNAYALTFLGVLLLSSAVLSVYIVRASLTYRNKMDSITD